jgi:hypothetical protein
MSALFTKHSTVQDIRSLVDGLLTEAKVTEHVERREETRHPFFRPVTIALDAGRGLKLSAFSREISASGIGLLHNMPLPAGEVQVTIERCAGGTATIRAEIIWCQPCGEGWYLSGARFLEPMRPV